MKYKLLHVTLFHTEYVKTVKCDLKRTIFTWDVLVWMTGIKIHIYYETYSDIVKAAKNYDERNDILLRLSTCL